MTQRQFGTLKYIDKCGKISQDDLRILHAGTLRSLMQNKWIFTWDAANDAWIGLTEAGMDALESFRSAEASMRKHEGDLTACTLRLLSMVRLRKAHHGIWKVG